MSDHARPLALAIALLAGCSAPPTASDADANRTSAGAVEPAIDNRVTPTATSPSPTSSATGLPQADYLGRWIGVEGMYLNVSPHEGGGVTLEMQYDLERKGSFPGSVTAEGLRFTRNGKAEIAVPSDGDATGLKWLAGKRDCLTVAPGEGYCRD